MDDFRIAAAGTTIATHIVAVVTLLADVLLSISADLEGAIASATISGHIVAVITLLTERGLSHTITALFDLAG